MAPTSLFLHLLRVGTYLSYLIYLCYLRLLTMLPLLLDDEAARRDAREDNAETQ